jgi:hypothetical protein
MWSYARYWSLRWLELEKRKYFAFLFVDILLHEYIIIIFYIIQYLLLRVENRVVVVTVGSLYFARNKTTQSIASQ